MTSWGVTTCEHSSDTNLDVIWHELGHTYILGHPAFLCSGNVEEARSILKSLETTIPGLAMVRLRRVSLERRHGNLDEAEALLREAMESAKTATETSFYAVKLARQQMKVERSLSKARKVLLDAIEKDQVRSEWWPWTDAQINGRHKTLVKDLKNLAIPY